MPGDRAMKIIRTVMWFGWKEKYIITGCLEMNLKGFELKSRGILYMRLRSFKYKNVNIKKLSSVVGKNNENQLFIYVVSYNE